MSGFPPLLALVGAASLVRLTCHRVCAFCVSAHPSVDVAVSTLGAVTTVLLGTAVHRFRRVRSRGHLHGRGCRVGQSLRASPPLGDPLLPAGAICSPPLLFCLLSVSICQQ